jgi:hypothetical protein
MRVEESSVYSVMKMRIIFVLAIAFAVNTFAEPILRYSGTVYYPSGKPAAGVHVAFYPGFYWGSGNYAETRTDTNGRYEIIQQPKTSNIMTGPMNPTNSIMASDVKENLAAIRFFDAGVSNVDLTLQPAITLSGSVKNTDGKPVPGAELDVRFLSGNSITPLRSQSTTVSELGLFFSPVLPQGREYWIYGIKAKGFGSAFAHVEATDTKAITYSFPPFVLKPANYRLAGRVLDNKGKPLIGTHVSFSGPSQPQDSSMNTDSEGRFFFDAVCEGPIKIFANYQDPQDSSIYINLNGGSGMEVKAGDTNILIKLTVGTRPVRTNEWKDVVLPGNTAPAAGSPKSAQQFPMLDGDSAKGLRLECSPGHETFTVGEKVWINCCVTNTTQETKPVAWTIGTGGNFSLHPVEEPPSGGSLPVYLLPVPFPRLNESLVVKDGYPPVTQKILYLPPGQSVDFVLDCGYYAKPQKVGGRIVYDPLSLRNGWWGTPATSTNQATQPPWANQLIASEPFVFEVVG